MPRDPRWGQEQHQGRGVAKNKKCRFLRSAVTVEDLSTLLLSTPAKQRVNYRLSGCSAYWVDSDANPNKA